MFPNVRRHLGLKLFLSYMLVIVVGIVVLASAVETVAPTAFDRHLSEMAAMMANMPGGMGGMGMGMGMMERQTTDLELDLFTNFRKAVNEALLRAALAAFAAAVLTSIFVSRRIVTPVREMMLASRRIAEGEYEERVRVPSNLTWEELDDLERLALSFNRMANRLEQTEATRRELIGNVAHELRTPLTTIKGSMEGLIDGVLPADPATFQQIHREVERLQRLVDDLQELSRVEAGAFTLNRRPVAVRALVETTVNRLGRQFADKGVTLETSVGDDLPPVWADEDRIGQVLLNLVGNALQYTPPGGRVTISARPTGEMVEIAVADTGVGIAAEHLPHLFTRFYRVDKSRSRAGGGSGIGLTIVRHLVEAHGGRVRAASDGPGKGSTFAFTLPVKKGAADRRRN
ncbi:MAG: sensor histidine kinase [Caldilineae bacterium]|nr:MAG: sensor histidine kinase [Caldilineae bacterium]